MNSLTDFHDTANAVATVIYTNSLKPGYAVVWSGLMNFLGVLLGGIAVAYALVELIPPEVLSPPNGGVASGMLAAIFISALVWNVGTWWFGLPNSSSHALIGSLVGITLATALMHGRDLKYAIDFHQVWSVLQIATIVKDMPAAAKLIERYGDDQKQLGVAAADAPGRRFSGIKSAHDIPASERTAVRNDFNRVVSEIRIASEAAGISDADKKEAKSIHENLMNSVQYAPWWVRVLSALCLGLGTMFGYRRIVTTLGERLGKEALVPAQGASAELVAAGLIGAAGFTGYPVSTTHVVTGGIAGTMVASGAGVQPAAKRQRSGGGLSRPAKLGENGLERGLDAEAFSRGQVAVRTMFG